MPDEILDELVEKFSPRINKVSDMDPDEQSFDHVLNMQKAKVSDDVYFALQRSNCMIFDRILVDKNFETNHPGIFCISSCSMQKIKTGDASPNRKVNLKCILSNNFLLRLLI